MKKKILMMFAVLSMMILALAGCGKKTAVTPEQFKSSMESRGYQVQDATEQFPEGSGVDKVYIALKDDYQIEFYQVETAEQAKLAFSQNKADFQALKGSSDLETNVESDQSSKYTLKTNGMYMVISRIDNTFIYVNADGKVKQEIEEVLKELDY